MNPRAFSDPGAFRAWLERNHSTASDLLVRIFKNHAAASGMTNAQAVDEALCFGWIDGVRRSLDGDSFTVRFSPRTARSVWSRINLARFRELEAEGRMTPAGRAVFERRDPKRTELYSFERPLELSPVLTRRFRGHAKAWGWFSSTPPGYRKITAHWVMSAKREETRVRRLDELIARSAMGRKIPILERKKEKS